jgi:5-methylcytosine-specific restriction endonuclease McrA
MDAALERLVRERAGSRCEYCRLPQIGSRAPFEIDHIIPRKHHGRTVAGNLALSCVYWMLQT